MKELGRTFGSAKWFDDDCKRAKRECVRLLQLGDIDYFESMSEYRKLKKEKKKEYYERTTLKQIIDAGPTLFSLFSRKSGLDCPVSAEEVQSHLEDLLHRPSSEEFEIESARLMTCFLEEEIIEAVAGLRGRKSTGIDGITNEQLQSSLPRLVGCWKRIFEYCIFASTLPSQWTTSLLILLYKGKGRTEDVNSYRGISLLCSPYKLFTKMVKERIEEVVEEKLYQFQYGFRRRRSTADAIGRVLERVEEAVEGRTRLYSLFVDYEKAFDSVDRGRLLHKLKTRFGLEDGLLRILQALLNTNNIVLRNQQCHCMGFHGKPTEIRQTRGVLQGDSLSPYLFGVYMDDIGDFVTERTDETTVTLYADDISLQSSSSKDMRKAILALAEWSSINGIKVNVAKTKMMKHRKAGRYARDDIFYYEGTEIEKVNAFTYLGVTLQPSLSFTKQINRVKQKGLTACALMALKLQKISLSAALKIFDSKVRPILTYSLHLYSRNLSARQMLELDKVKSRFLKRVLAVPTWTGNEFVYKLCDSPRFCVELKEKDYELDDDEYDEYLRELEDSKERESRRKRNPEAFEDDSWKGIMQPRHLVIGFTAHGHHHLLCKDASFHAEPGDACECRLCGAREIDVSHLKTCSGLFGSLGDRYRNIL